MNRILSLLGLRHDTFFQAIALAFTVGIAVLSLAELGSRLEYLGYLDVELQAKSQELNAKLQAALQVQGPENGAKTTNDSSRSDIKSLSYDITELTYRRDLVMRLVFKGARDDRKDLTYILGTLDSQGKSFVAATPDNPDADSAPGTPDFVARVMEMITLHFDWLSSNVLVAILLCACGTIGALTAGLRTNEFTTFRDMCLGIGTGFICYLTIRGGKDLFVSGLSLARTSLNPYSSGLTAVLAGLFSERFFQLLSFLFDSITARLKAAFGSETDPARPAPITIGNGPPSGTNG